MKALRPLWLAWGLLLGSFFLLLLGLGVGSTGWDSVWRILREQPPDPLAWQIVRDIRLPRTIGAWLAGALLGVAGAVAQGIFRNPLADPYLLGSASGATLAVALTMAALGASPFALPGFLRVGVTGAAFVGAVAAVLLTLLLAKGAHSLRLLLAGVVVGVVFAAGSSLVLQLAPEIMLVMQSFVLGSTAFMDWGGCAVLAAVLALALLGAWSLGRFLDALALGEATAQSLGLPLAPLRMLLIALLALATAAAVAQCGLIAFVGLAAPHLVRSLVQVLHRWLLLLSAAMGAVLLLAADLLARVLVAPQEIPVGVLTALLGGSYLLWLMHRRNAQELS